MQTVGIEPGYKKILKYAVSDSGETDWAIKLTVVTRVYKPLL